jgi:hypothetical protein
MPYYGQPGAAAGYYGGYPTFDAAAAQQYYAYYQQQQQQQPGVVAAAGMPMYQPQLPPTMGAMHGPSIPTTGGGGNSGGGGGGGGGMGKRGPLGANLFVMGFPDSTEDTQLWQLFSVYGTILSAQVFKDKDTGRTRGFGFVSFDDPNAARAAIAALNGHDMGAGRRLKVDYKKGDQ